jgi:hypothetical protein
MRIREKDGRDSVTSHILPSYKATLIFIFLGVILIFSSFSWLSIFPFCLLCTKGLHSSFFNGILLAIIWGGYLLLLVWTPLTLLSISSQYIWFALYSPLFFMLLKDMKRPPSALVIMIQYLLYEIPLMLWVHLLRFFGARALTVISISIPQIFCILSRPAFLFSNHRNNCSRLSSILV